MLTLPEHSRLHQISAFWQRYQTEPDFQQQTIADNAAIFSRLEQQYQTAMQQQDSSHTGGYTDVEYAAETVQPFAATTRLVAGFETDEQHQLIQRLQLNLITVYNRVDDGGYFHYAQPVTLYPGRVFISAPQLSILRQTTVDRSEFAVKLLEFIQLTHQRILNRLSHIILNSAATLWDDRAPAEQYQLILGLTDGLLAPREFFDLTMIKDTTLLPLTAPSSTALINQCEHLMSLIPVGYGGALVQRLSAVSNWAASEAPTW